MSDGMTDESRRDRIFKRRTEQRTSRPDKKPVFYGEPSKELWDKINATPGYELRDLLYLMGCKLQELEHRLETVENRE